MSDEPKDAEREAGLKRIEERLDYLDEILHQQVARIYMLEKMLAERDLPTTQSRVLTAAATAEPPPPTTFVPATPAISTTLHPSQSVDLESLIAGNWFNRIGIMAIIFAVGFFLKYAFENQWIGAIGRVAIGIVVGIGFLIAGESILRRGYRFYAHGLSGGGIAILYLSIYAAFGRYHLMTQPLSFALMSMVTVVAVVLSARYDALAIAVLGLIMGFLTPVILSTGEDNQTALFGYMILLDLGVLAIARFKRWRILNYLAFAATIILSAAWWEDWYRPEKLWLTLLFFTLLFLIFAFTAVIHNIIERKPASEIDALLILLNGALYFLAVYRLLDPEHHSILGGYAIGLAIFYSGQGYWSYRQDRADRYLTLTFLGLAVGFVTIALPLQFDQIWLTIGWTIEALALFAIGLKLDRRLTRLAAGGLFLLASIHWFDVDISGFAEGYDRFRPIFNRHGASSLIMILSLAAAARLSWRSREVGEERERAFWAGLFGLLASLLTVIWISHDGNGLFYALEASDRGYGPLESLRHLFLIVWWSLAGTAMMIAGIRQGVKGGRAIGALLLMASSIEVYAASAYASESWHRTLFNPTFAGFLTVSLALLICYRDYVRAGDGVEKGESMGMRRLLLGLANILLLAGLGVEVDAFFARRAESRDWTLLNQLSLSILYVTYGGALVIVGIWRSSRQARLMGLALIALTIVKVFLFDLSSLDKIYRVLSFIVLGLVLLLVSFLYQKRRVREDQGGTA